jgi:Xaa-Pro aminopeptidase
MLMLSATSSASHEAARRSALERVADARKGLERLSHVADAARSSSAEADIADLRDAARALVSAGEALLDWIDNGGACTQSELARKDVAARVHAARGRATREAEHLVNDHARRAARKGVRTPPQGWQ